MTPPQGTVATYSSDCALEKEGIPSHFRQLETGSELTMVSRDLKHHYNHPSPPPLLEEGLWSQLLN